MSKSKPYAKLVDRMLEESVLSYAQRKKLKTPVLCGPNRSYPAHDRKHAANGLARAAQSLKKGNLSRAQYNKIVACLRRRLKKYGGTPSSETVEWFKKQKGIE